MTFGNWWNQNFVQPSTGVYEGTSFASQPYKNSTGVIQPTVGTKPPTPDNYSFMNNNITSATAGANNAFAPIGSSAVSNAITGSTPVSTSAPMSVADQYAAYNSGYGATNNTISPMSTSTTGGFDWGNIMPDINWDTVSNVTDAATGIFSVYQGMQNLGLAQDQFDFRKNAWQQDYNQRLDAYNTEVERRAGRDAALAGG